MSGSCHDESAPSAPSSEDPILLASAPCIVPLSAIESDPFADFGWILPPALAVPVIPAEISRGSFLQTYGTAPLRVLTGVIRC